MSTITRMMLVLGIVAAIAAGFVGGMVYSEHGAESERDRVSVSSFNDGFKDGQCAPFKEEDGSVSYIDGAGMVCIKH
ncbi:hypothetical protein ACN20G_23315 [Streptomyces sp. BI20]|uniref:hypothetical protein n=1 Tax=Streptomyces sp. BI20 TaxID=3403460 RepID=UPI003C7834C1